MKFACLRFQYLICNNFNKYWFNIIQDKFNLRIRLDILSNGKQLRKYI
jgi:hypothetical protein